MKIEKLTFANALALNTLMLWVICSLIAALSPAFYMQTGSWWMHGMMRSAYLGGWSPMMTTGSFSLGGITIVAVAWVTGYIFGWSYEQVSNWNKKK